jgi:hypothetical protein
MDYILLIIETAVVVSVLCTARAIVRSWKHKLPECVAPLRSSRLHSIDAARTSMRSKPQVERISVKECENLIHSFDNVVFIALRQGSERTPLPFPAKVAVSIAPSELADVLKLIPDCRVVLCGEVDLCNSISETLKDIARSAPVYVLESAAACAEAV